MPSKKLIMLLEGFSGFDLNRFRRYLISPYFNENQDIIQLYDLIDSKLREQKISAESDHSAEKERLWKELFGKKGYHDAHMRRLLSELNRHAQGFLALERYRDNELEEKYQLLELFNDRGFSSHFSAIVRQIQKIQAQSNFRDARFHQYLYSLEENLFEQAEKEHKNAEMLASLEKAIYHLDCYFIAQRLKLYHNWLDYKNIFSTPSNVSLPVFFMEWLEESGLLQEPVIYVYYLMSKMLLHPDNDVIFQKLKTYLTKEAACFKKTELVHFYVALINYCIDTKINVGRTEYFKELFEIYQILLEQDLLLKNGVLLPQDYKTIITVGLYVQAFNWVENFIETYTDKLPPADQENAKTYNLAKVYFQQRQYDKVIEQLREVEYQNLNYALGGKLMLLKTYYELHEYLPLDSLAESFRIYLQRNKLISKEVRQQYLNVLRFTKKLSNIRPGDEAAIARIRQQINDCKALADKSWILQKLEELER